MPTVKWVQKYDLREGPQPIETGPITFIPILTLDELEEWLCGEVEQSMTIEQRSVLKVLLAQVQAMRGEQL